MTDHTDNLLLHTQFSEHARNSPESIAIEINDTRISNANLFHYSRHAANQIKRLNEPSKKYIAILMHKGWEQAVAALSVSMSGFAYLPIDPDWPIKRISYLLKEANVETVLTQKNCALGELESEIKNIITIEEKVAINAPEHELTEPDAEKTAYAIFTSGSTGQPKGVMINHQGAVNTILDINSRFNIAASDKILAISALNFDLSVYDIFGSLSAGATIVMPDKNRLKDPGYLWDLMIERQVTVWNSVPQLMNLLVNHGESSGNEKRLPLKTVLLSGDWIPLSLPDRIKALCEPGCQVISLGGATEASIWSVLYPISHTDPSWKSIPYGKAMNRQTIQVLNEALEPCKAGETGDIYIGGIGLAIGYMNDPEKTQRSFIRHPRSGERLYRTGDLGRYFTDGNIEFLGRQDHQIKYLGYRIESGEIESVLNRHPQVKDNSLLMRNDGDGRAQLVSYIVLNNDQHVEDSEERLDQWREIYDQVYSAGQAEDVEFNISGWNSSYDGQPLPAEQMRMWLDETVNDILSFKPRRVLEIGCGTGMILYQVAPHCEHYSAVDMSDVAVNTLNSMIRKQGLDNIHVYCRAAHECGDLPDHEFDTIVINSVTQHFPSMQYFFEVLENAAHLIKEGGRIYVGDIRSLPLLENFHASIELFRASDNDRACDIMDNVKRKIAAESDLCIHPDFFNTLQNALPEMTAVDIQPKTANYDNELTQFRYQAILHIGKSKQISCPTSSQDWSDQGMTLERLQKKLTQEKPHSLAFHGIPNRRLTSSFMTKKLLSESNLTAKEIRAALSNTSDNTSVDPNQLHNILSSSGYQFRLQWSDQHQLNGLTMQILSAEATDHTTSPEINRVTADKNSIDWSQFGNVPFVVKQNINADLRQHLKENLPEYMIPSAFVFLDSFPLTPNGKLDRSALPAPVNQRTSLSVEYVSPQTPLQEILSGIWAAAFKQDCIGIYDDFFELGGDSITAMQIASLAKAEGLSIRNIDILSTQNVAALSQKVQNQLPEKVTAMTVQSSTQERLQPFPLTTMQQAYWLGTQADFEMGGIHANWYLEISFTQLNEANFQRAWQRVINRHEGLRCVLTADGFQKVLPEPGSSLIVEDLTQHSSVAIQEEILKTRSHVQNSQFSLEQGPLFSLRLLRLPEQKYRFYFNISLLICDGWSFTNLVHDFRHFYAQSDAELPENEIQLRDYVTYLQDSKRYKLREKAQKYWLDRLDLIPPAPELPLIHHYTSKSFHLTHREYEVSQQDWQATKSTAARMGIAPGILVAGIFSEVLSKWSNSQHFSLNILHFNRYDQLQQIKHLISNFSSTLLLEVNLNHQESFINRLKRLQSQFWQDLEHTDFSGVELIRALNKHHGSTLNAAMPVAFASLIGLTDDSDWSDYIALLPGGKTVCQSVQTPQVYFDHQVYERNGSLVLSADIYEAVFPPGMIDDIFETYLNLFQKLSEQPNTWYLKNVINLPESHLAVQRQANESATDSPKGMLFSGFKQHLQTQPDQRAIVTSSLSISYQELNQKSLILADALIRIGCQRGDIVGIMAPKGWQQPVAALAILRIGAAYLPLDPQLPAKRIDYITRNANVRFALVTDAMETQLPGVHCLNISQITEQPAPSGINYFQDVEDDQALAYVIYTSGTTGQPKGVMMNHQAAMNTIHDVNRRFQIGSDDRLLALSSLSFDLSVYDIFGILSAGGTLVIPDEEHHLDPAHWLALVHEFKVTVWNTAPQFMELFSDFTLAANENNLPIQTILLSGDWIPLGLPEQIRQYCKHVKIYSLGGATEAAIWSCYYPIQQVQPDWPSIPYGKPLANQSLHILDEDMNPCPLWVRGKLYIGGDGLALGYLGDDKKTASKFIKDMQDQRLYFTGDTARYLPDGNLEFMGREDSQIKYKGFRIELGEIEAHLLHNHLVHQAVVSVEASSNARETLVAFIVCAQTSDSPQTINGNQLINKDLTAHLQDELPGYMVPEHIIELPAIPFTPNGKIDRKQLSAIFDRTQTLQPLNHTHSLPRNSLESTLADIWQSLIGGAVPDIHANFFDCGGDSFLAVRFIAGIKQNCQQQLSLALFSQNPSIAFIAEALQADTEQNIPDSVAVELQTGNRKNPALFFVHGIGGSITAFHHLARHLKDFPFFALQQQSALGTLNCVEDIASSYIEAMKQQQPTGPYYLSGWSFGGLVAFEMTKQLQENGEEVALLTLLDSGAEETTAPPDSYNQAVHAKRFLDDLSQQLGQEKPHLLPPEHLDFEALTHRVLNIAKQKQLLPEALEKEQFSDILKGFFANAEALIKYSQERISRAGTFEIPGMRIIQAKESKEVSEQQRTFWQRFNKHTTVFYAPGDHYSMLQEPNVQEIAQHLRNEIQNLSAQCPVMETHSVLEQEV